MHRWEKHPTTGIPPLGVWGYGCCLIEKDIFYFAGYCGHVTCYHNSLFYLSTETLIWNELFATSGTSGPMMKAYCALLPFDDQLLAFGGRGVASPSNPSPSAQYELHAYKARLYTNEHHLFDLKRSEHHF